MGRRNKVKYKYNPEQEDADERLMNERLWINTLFIK